MGPALERFNATMSELLGEGHNPDYSRFGRSPDNRFQWHRHAGALSNEHEAEWWGNPAFEAFKFYGSDAQMVGLLNLFGNVRGATASRGRLFNKNDAGAPAIASALPRKTRFPSAPETRALL